MKRNAIKLLVVHMIALAGCMAFPLYQRAIELVPRLLSGCFLHDLFFLYCPLCGGTRAVSALLRGALAEALACNALVVLVILAAIALYVVAWIRFFRRKERLLWLPRRWFLICVVAVAAFGIGRNLLMLTFSFDPLGDLIWFWNWIL